MTFEEERRAGLGSTDSPAILGLSPWKTAHDVWMEKRGQAPPREPSLPMFLGSRLEATIAELYTANTGLQLTRDEGQYLTPGGIVRAHVDFRDATGGVVETKTARSHKGWGDDLFSDHVPRNYWTQVQHQMACVPDVPHVDIAVLFGHHDFRIYRVPRHEAFIASLVPDMEAWWEKHVVKDQPPPVDGSESAGRWLRETYPSATTEELIPATPEQQRLVEDLLITRQTMAALQQVDARIVQELQEIIKTAPGMYGSQFIIKWRQNKSSKKVHWDDAFNDLKVASEAPEALISSIVASHTEIKAGARPFIIERIESD